MGASAEKVVRQKWCLLQATMDERARRLWSGTEAGAIGWGGVAAVARAQVEQGGASPVLVHLDQLARTPSADLRDRHQPHWQHDQPRWSRRARPTRSSALSHRQEDLKEGTARTEGRA